MDFSQAKLIIWNAESYPRRKVRQAAQFIISSLAAKQADIVQAVIVA